MTTYVDPTSYVGVNTTESGIGPGETYLEHHYDGDVSPAYVSIQSREGPGSITTTYPSIEVTEITVITVGLVWEWGYVG